MDVDACGMLDRKKDDQEKNGMHLHKESYNIEFLDIEVDIEQTSKKGPEAVFTDANEGSTIKEEQSETES